MTAEAYQALGFDPAPGDVSSVHALATAVRMVARQVADAGTDIGRVGKAGSVWYGDAANAFHGAIGDLPGKIDNAGQSFLGAARAIESWADDLAGLQRRGRQAETDAEAAKRRLGATQGHLDALNAQPQTHDKAKKAEHAQNVAAASRAVSGAQSELEAARSRGQRILSEHGSRAGVAASSVRTFSDYAPPEPGFFSRLANDFVHDLEGLSDWLGKEIREHAALLEKIADGLSMVAAGLAFVPGAGWVAAAAAGGTALLIRTGLAVYGGGSWSDVAWDAAGMLTLGAGRVAEGGIRAARGLEESEKVPGLLKTFKAGYRMAGTRELSWRAAQLNVTGLDKALNANALAMGSSEYAGWPTHTAPDPWERPGYSAAGRAGIAEGAGTESAASPGVAVPAAGARRPVRQ